VHFLQRIILTERLMGPTWEVRFCLTRPPDRNSLLGMITQNPVAVFVSDFVLIHPWTLRFMFSLEYWYLSSTLKCQEKI
jgi:hypothetical protein